VLPQKVCGQHFNCCIDEMHTLIANQSERTIESSEDVFIYELCSHYSCVGVQHLGFHPLGGIINCHQYVPISYGLAN